MYTVSERTRVEHNRACLEGPVDAPPKDGCPRCEQLWDPNKPLRGLLFLNKGRTGRLAVSQKPPSNAGECVDT